MVLMMLGDTLDEAKNQNYAIFQGYEDCEGGPKLEGKHRRKQADLVQNIVKSKKVTSRKTI